MLFGTICVSIVAISAFGRALILKFGTYDQVVVKQIDNSMPDSSDILYRIQLLFKDWCTVFGVMQ